MQIWLTETSSSWASIEGAMNAFLHGFWYLASLGQYAQTGLTAHSRWQLLSTDTSTFINTSSKSYSVLPDYWIAVVYKRVVGPKVFKVSSAPDQIFAYAQCGTSPGAVTLIVGNPSATSITIEVNGLHSQTHDEYIFTAPTLESYVINLNNEPLSLTPNGTLPLLQPRKVTGSSVVLPGYSYGFAVFPNSGATQC